MRYNCITAPREPYYLPQTLNSFKTFHNEPVTFFVEPGIENIASPWENDTFIHNDNTLSTVGNWLQVVEHTLNYDDQYHMIFEDDILFLNHIDITGLPEDYIISPYCSNKNKLTYYRNVWHKPTSPNNWCGACCTIFPRNILTHIIKNKEEFLYFTESHTLKKPVHLDTAIGRIANKHFKGIITHTPSLIDHIGIISTNPLNNKNPEVPWYRVAAK